MKEDIKQRKMLTINVRSDEPSSNRRLRSLKSEEHAEDVLVSIPLHSSETRIKD